MLMWICFVAGFFAPWCFAVSGVLLIRELLQGGTKSFYNKTDEPAPVVQNKQVANEISFDKDKIFIKLPLEWYEVVKELQQFSDPAEGLVFVGHKEEDGKLLLEFRKSPEAFIKNIEIKRTPEGFRVNIVYDDGESDV